MGFTMSWIIQANIDRFNDLLKTETMRRSEQWKSACSPRKRRS
jgi:hypothetical protein